MRTKTAAPQPAPPTRHHKKCILKHWYLNYRNFLDNSNIVAQQIRKHAKLFCSIFRNFVLATIINPLNRDKEFRDTQQHGRVPYIYKGKEDGIQVLYKNETIWTTQKAMAELFDVDRTVITKHLKNIFESSELQINSVCAKFAHTADDGKTYNTAFYNLDAIIWPSGTYR